MRSATDVWPDGLGSSSGELGHNLMDHHFRVGATGALPSLSVDNGEGKVSKSAEPGLRRMYLGDWTDVSVYSFDSLAAGATIDGPAVVESDTTTVVLRAGDHATVTPQQWLDIRIG